MSESPSQTATVSLSTADGRLRVDFDWQTDRFVQQLFIDGVEVGRSIEGNAQQDWPASPPIQQLSLESINGANVILGVGAAGRAHWSISVEATPENTLKFDLACRSKQKPASLASTYALSDALRLMPLGTCQPQSLTASNWDLGEAAAQQGDRQVKAFPDNQTDSPTSQWSYQLVRKD